MGDLLDLPPGAMGLAGLMGTGALHVVGARGASPSTASSDLLDLAVGDLLDLVEGDLLDLVEGDLLDLVEGDLEDLVDGDLLDLPLPPPPLLEDLVNPELTHLQLSVGWGGDN